MGLFYSYFLKLFSILKNKKNKEKKCLRPVCLLFLKLFFVLNNNKDNKKNGKNMFSFRFVFSSSHF